MKQKWKSRIFFLNPGIKNIQKSRPEKSRDPGIWQNPVPKNPGIEILDPVRAWSRDDDYNLQRQSNIEFLHIPSCQIIRSWNQNHLSLKSEADFATLKEDFIQKKLNSYDEECFKPNCKACRDKTWLYSISMQPNRTAICASKTVTDSKDSYAPTNIPCLLIHVPIIWAELGWFETMSSFLLFKSKLF